MTEGKEFELAVLSAVFCDNDCIRVLAAELEIDDFEEFRHQLIWTCFLNLYNDRERIDAISVLSWMKQHKKEKEIGKEFVVSVRDYLASIGEESTENVLAWSTEVKDRSGRRKLMQVCDAIKERVKDGREELDEVHAQALEALMGCRRIERQGFKRVGDFVSSVLEVSRVWFEGRTNAVSTGYPTLDAMLGGGLFGKRLYVLGGRPGTSKTSFVTGLMRNIAEDLKREGKPGVVCLSSLEMAAEDVYIRAACSGARIDEQILMAGGLHGRKDLQKRFEDELEYLKSLPIWIDDADSVTSAMLHYRASLLHALEGVSLLVVDFAELIKDASGDEELRVSGVFKAGKAIAKALSIPVIILSQLNREVDKTENKLPGLRHLRWGGSAEAVADSVLLAYDPYLYEEMGENIVPPEGMRVSKDTWYLLVSKSRYGRLGYVPFRIEREFLRISDESVRVRGRDEF